MYGYRGKNTINKGNRDEIIKKFVLQIIMYVKKWVVIPLTANVIPCKLK